MKKALNFMTYVYTEAPKEPVVGVSRTRPDMAFTPKDILARYAQGKPLPGSNGFGWITEEYVPDLSRLDLTEQEEVIAAHYERMAALKADVDAKVAARKAAFNERRKEFDDYRRYVEAKNNAAKGSSGADDVAAAGSDILT